MSFVKDSVRTAVVRVSILGINIFAAIVHARWLGPEGVGILALFALIQNISFRFGNLGFGSGFSYFMAKQQATAKELTRFSWVISLTMTLLSCILLALFWKTKWSPWRELPPAIFYLGFITIPLFYLKNYFQRILSGQLRIKVVNVSEIISAICYIPLMSVLVIFLSWGIMGAVIANIAAQTIVMLYLNWCLKKSSAQETGSGAFAAGIPLIKAIWNYGRWSYLIFFLNFFQEQLPLMILTYFYPAAVVGFFSMGRNLMMRTQLLPQSFAQVLFPFTAAAEAQEATKRTNTLCRHFLIFMGAGVVVLGVVAQPIIVLLFGEAFLPAVTVLYALLPAILLYPLTQFLPVHVAAFGNPRIVFIRNLIATPACLLFCLLLVPPFGAIGAALSLSAMYALLALLNLFIYLKSTGSNFSDVVVPNYNDWLYYKKLYKAKIMGFAVH